MFHEDAGVRNFSELMVLCLPSAFSVILLVLAGIPPALCLLTGRAPTATPEQSSLTLLFVGLLGATVNMVLVQQHRRIRALESALQKGPVGSSA